MQASSFRSTPSYRASLASDSVYKACRGESNSISAGMIDSEPYTRKNGVNPVEQFGVVLKLHKTTRSYSTHAPGALSSGSTNRELMTDRMRPFALSAWPFDWGCATDATSS